MTLDDWHSPVKSQLATISMIGPADDIIHVTQQLAWMTAVFRVPKYDQLSYSDVILERTQDLEFSLELMDLQKVKASNNSCWHPLFMNSVLARGFDVPKRSAEVGIEVPFDLMVSLACILYPFEYQDGTILRGIESTLVPTTQHPGAVQWHCISKDQGSSMPSVDKMMMGVPKWFRTRDFELLRTARTFLGYCSVTEIHLGSRDIRDMGYKEIEVSSAERERTRLEASGEFATTLGLSAKGIISMSLSPKFTISRGQRLTTKKLELFFQDRLDRAKDQPSLLYDVEKKQGWLVPEICVVLHMAHARVRKQRGIPKDAWQKSLTPTSRMTQVRQPSTQLRRANP